MLFFVIGMAILGGVVNYLLLRFLRTLGTKDQEANFQVRWSSQTKPTIGGISFFIGFLVTLVVTLLFSQEEINVAQFGVIAVSVIIAFLMGLADDAFNTKPWLKFSVQLLCGIVLVAGGVQIDLGWGNAIEIPLTILWVAGLMNSVNMLDNMDGVTTTAALPVLLLVWWLNPDGVTGWLALGMLATLIGFLFVNWHPSKVYMGDSGSQLLGALLAGLTIMECWNHEGFAGGGSTLLQLIVPVLALATTLTDTTLVTINRLRHGRSPFVGGRDHSTHNLSYLGLSDQSIAFTYFCWSLVNVFLAFLLIQYQGDTILRWEIGVILYLMLVFISFFMISRRNLKHGKYTYS
ncbi:MAG: MraY family glycosyltransferase [Flavobacteriales bacterium]|nr:MraY family glycosyltransferase [Flavobacteriales bacterium]